MKLKSDENFEMISSQVKLDSITKLTYISLIKT
jgi:hypothetical protein